LLSGLACLGALLFIIPIAGLMSRVPWRELPDLVGSEIVTEALRLSLVTSCAAVAISLLLGVPLAWVLARVDFPAKSVVRAVVTLPMVLPPVVGGAALLFALGRRGLVGRPLDEATGITLPFTTWGVVVANTFVAMPFLVVAVEGALRSLDDRYEHAAATLGASRLTILRRITIPMIAPSLRAGAVLTWARALGEFGATITFAGNLQGRTQTLPLAVYVALERDRDSAIALSLILVAIALTVLISMRRYVWTTTP
jgi:molybdate transport system permease protein